MTKSKTPDFHYVVRQLRAIPERYRILALYAATYWSDEKLDQAERDGDLPGRPGEIKPTTATRQ
jgi:hypothetical protein